MTMREFFVETMRDELPRFERVMNAVPDAGLDYRPHDRSRCARDLVGLFADESAMFTTFLETGEIEVTKCEPGSYARGADAVVAFVKNIRAAADKASAMSEEDWAKPARLLVQGKADWETTRGRMAWGLLLDLIHHRGQLSVYLRPMGATVPAIYGPSADANA